MSCKALVVVASVMASACADNAETVQVVAHATEDVELIPLEREALADEATYRWVLVDAPAGSGVDPPGGGSVAKFRPDMRGEYVLERWIVYGLSERLTYRFDVNAAGIPPVPSIDAALTAKVGESVTLDGSASESAEGLPLQYRWRLASRPGASAAGLASPEGTTTSLALDVAGTFAVELMVFDGQLWSASPSTHEVTAVP